MKHTLCLYFLLAIILTSGCKKVTSVAGFSKAQKLPPEKTDTIHQGSPLNSEKKFLLSKPLISVGLLIPNPTPKLNMGVEFFIDTNSRKKWTFMDSLYHPFVSSSPDYSIFAVRCLKIYGNWCRIVINERDETKLWYNLSNEALVFQSWENFILSVFSIEVDRSKNPLKEQPFKKSNNALLLVTQEEESLHPIEIKHDWLKVEIGSTGKYAWVRWREDNELLVELIYLD